MDETLRAKAKTLASAPYTTRISRDETTDGDPIFVVYNPELPGCLAQGQSREEAYQNLQDAREEFILSLLQDQMSVPSPEQFATRTVAGVGNAVTFSQFNVPQVSHRRVPYAPQTNWNPPGYVGEITIPPSENDPADTSETSITLITLGA